MPASPCPIPGVSMIIRSKPAHLTAAMISGNCEGTSLPALRVASERTNTLSLWMAFIRMRSPSKAPPVLRRVGSTAITATRKPSAWSSRQRRINSSVSEDLPEPPVPVMPSTGARGPLNGAPERSCSTRDLLAVPFSRAVISRASKPRSLPPSISRLSRVSPAG